jgi:hypothetical protein
MSIYSRPAGFRLAGAIILAAIWTATAPAGTNVTRQRSVWLLENARLQIRVDAEKGHLAVLQKASGRQWRQPPNRSAAKPEGLFRNVRESTGQQHGIVFEADFGRDKSGPNTMLLKLVLPDAAADLLVEADMQDRHAKVGRAPFLEPFLLDSNDGVLVVADYCNGHLYPLDANPFPCRSGSASRLDMPWVGVCDMAKGDGYSIIVETSDDAFIECNPYSVGDRKLAAPRIGWVASKGEFSYPRRLIYHFSDRGGYVALAKRYRDYAQEHGLLVCLEEKAKKNPNLKRLFGAPDVWGWGGRDGLKAIRAAKAAGVTKMLAHGRFSPADLKAINELGYLTSEYDNYTDVLPIPSGKGLDSNHDRIPESVVLKADGQRMTAWLTLDKQQYMKRCPALWVATAQQVIPKVLKTHPFLGRFIDVTTAEELYECFDPKHPLAHADKRACGVALLEYVRSQGLVVGGEHGIWWAVPQVDYIEGMMSGSHYSWLAGHLIHPKAKDEEAAYPGGHKLGPWSDYARWGIGHEGRVPLWELVFHDCVVSTWYWGDSNDWLLQAAPEVTAKKDAFNILYGTIPLLWTTKDSSWQSARDVFLRTYRNTCKLHEAIAGTQMLSHEFVSPDRALQRTRFSDGTEVFVNFGPEPRTVQLAGRSQRLPENGFAVKGPKIEQSLELIDGKAVTSIRTADYSFTDADKGPASQ